MKKIKVYTSASEYIAPCKKAKFLDYSNLSVYPWAKKRMEEMAARNPSPAEEKFLSICSGFKYNLFRQVFFQIKKKCYFLDFFMPDKLIAIEIDGKQHKEEEQAAYDKVRDAAFLSIGIRTIRFTTDQLKEDDFLHKYLVPALSGVNKKLVFKHGLTYHQKELLQINDFLEKCGNGETVEVRSADTSILRGLSHKDSPKIGARDFALLAKFYELKRSKNLAICCRYVGRIGKMKKSDVDWVNRLSRKCDRLNAPKFIKV